MQDSGPRNLKVTKIYQSLSANELAVKLTVLVYSINPSFSLSIFSGDSFSLLQLRLVFINVSHNECLRFIWHAATERQISAANVFWSVAGEAICVLQTGEAICVFYFPTLLLYMYLVWRMDYLFLAFWVLCHHTSSVDFEGMLGTTARVSKIDTSPYFICCRRSALIYTGSNNGLAFNYFSHIIWPPFFFGNKRECFPFRRVALLRVVKFYKPAHSLFFSFPFSVFFFHFTLFSFWRPSPFFSIHFFISLWACHYRICLSTNKKHSRK